MKAVIIALCISFTVSGAASALNFHEDFSSPAGATQGPGDPGRFVFSAGKLTARYDSLADPVRLYMPLGGTLTDGDSFEFGANVRILSAGFEASYFGNFQIAFGLVNETGDAKNKTGLNRATPFGESADVYNNIEVDYFPNAFYGFGPNFGVSAFGPAANAGDDAFWNFQSPEYEAFQIGDQSGESDLPRDVLLNIYASYDAGGGLLTYGARQWTGAAWSPLVIYVDPTTHDAFTEITFDPFLYRSDWNPGITGFSVNAFAISLYKDPFDDGELADDMQSLRANVEFDEVYCGAPGGPQPVPEPASIMMLLGGYALFVRLLRKK